MCCGSPGTRSGNAWTTRRRALWSSRKACSRRRTKTLDNETVLAWDRNSGTALTPAIVWQDRRSAGVCGKMSADAGRLAALTGLPLDPYFAAPKMTWLRENITGDGTVTTTDSWLLARLAAGYGTDAPTAS